MNPRPRRRHNTNANARLRHIGAKAKTYQRRAALQRETREKHSTSQSGQEPPKLIDPLDPQASLPPAALLRLGQGPLSPLDACLCCGRGAGRCVATRSRTRHTTLLRLLRWRFTGPSPPPYNECVLAKGGALERRLVGSERLIIDHTHLGVCCQPQLQLLHLAGKWIHPALARVELQLRVVPANGKTGVYICVYIWVYLHIDIDLHTQIYIYIYIYIHICIFNDIYLSTYLSIRLSMYLYINIHTHTYTNIFI